MKDTPKISSLDIKCFRGLKNLKLDDFSNINIFVGGNNSGKTSVLELLKLMSAPYDVKMLKNVALQRMSDSVKRRKNIVEYIKNMKLTITSSLGFKGAMVTCGGVSTKEVDASTLESKKIENLFITGELLDLDAETGGYNLQIAFSTGYLAGLSLN